MKEPLQLHQTYPVYDENNELTEMTMTYEGYRAVEAPFSCKEPFQFQHVFTLQIPNKKPQLEFIVFDGYHDTPCDYAFYYKAKRYHINPYVLLFSLS